MHLDYEADLTAVARGGEATTISSYMASLVLVSHGAASIRRFGDIVSDGALQILAKARYSG